MSTPTPTIQTEERTILPPSRQRRNRIWLAAAIVLVALGALLGWYTVANLRDTTQVVAIRTDVPRGAIITAQDLTTADINHDPVLQTVPAAQVAQVVGKRAAIDLQAGSLLTQAAYAETILPSTGNSVVGLALEPGQLPATPLRVGDKVRLVSTPKDQDDPSSTPPTVTIAAEVVSANPLTDTTKTRVDVLVKQSDAALVAGVAATNRVAVILDSSQR